MDNNQGGAPPEQGPALPLVSYYEGALTATKCRERLRKEGKFGAPDSAQQALLGKLGVLDPDLARTWSLFKGEIRKPRPVPILAEWLHRVVVAVRKPDGAPQSVRQTVASLSEEHLPTKGVSSKRNLNAWRLGVLDLRWQRELVLEQLTVVLAEHFVRPAERTDALEGKVLAMLVGGSKGQLANVAAIVSWMTRLTATQSMELSRIRGELEAAQNQRARLQGRLSAVEADSERLRGLLREAEEREAEARRSLVEAEDAAKLRLHDIAGRTTGKLTTRIMPLLDQAEDALTMAEPSVRAAREFVNTARKESEGLSQWLRAESTSEPPTA